MTFPVKDEETQVYRVISEISKVTPSKNNSRHEPHFQIRSIKYSPPMATDLLPNPPSSDAEQSHGPSPAHSARGALGEPFA